MQKKTCFTEKPWSLFDLTYRAIFGFRFFHTDSQYIGVARTGDAIPHQMRPIIRRTKEENEYRTGINKQPKRDLSRRANNVSEAYSCCSLNFLMSVCECVWSQFANDFTMDRDHLLSLLKIKLQNCFSEHKFKTLCFCLHFCYCEL